METIGAPLSKNLLRIVACTLLAAMLPASGCQRDFPNPNAPIVDDVTIQSLVAGAPAGVRGGFLIYFPLVLVVGGGGDFFFAGDPRLSRGLRLRRPHPGGYFRL